MSIKCEREIERQHSGYQNCVEELAWSWVARWVWVISKNSNADARYQNCLIFRALRCIFASNLQHIIMFLDQILYFFGDWSKDQSLNLKYIVFFQISPHNRIKFCFSMATLVMIIVQHLSLISSCSR